MKESYVEGLANHNGPESCVDGEIHVGEALTGVRAGRVLKPRNKLSRDADPLNEVGKAKQIDMPLWQGMAESARSETPGMHGNNLRENREILTTTSWHAWVASKKS